MIHIFSGWILVQNCHVLIDNCKQISHGICVLLMETTICYVFRCDTKSNDRYLRRMRALCDYLILGWDKQLHNSKFDLFHITYSHTIYGNLSLIFFHRTKIMIVFNIDLVQNATHPDTIYKVGTADCMPDPSKLT